MSIESLCTGDKVRKLTLTDGDFGEPPNFTDGEFFDCRIDLSGGVETDSEGVASGTRNGTVFFAKNPKLRIGHYLRWISRGNTLISETVMFRVTYIDDAEGRPGDDPWLFSVEVSEDKSVSEFIKDERAAT